MVSQTVATTVSLSWEARVIKLYRYYHAKLANSAQNYISKDFQNKHIIILE